MENVIIIAILLAVFAGAILFIVKEKKSGKKCIGCPYAASCAKECKKRDEQKRVQIW